MYGELYNELRDREGDLKAGLTHTANLLGPRLTQVLMLALLGIGGAAGLAALLVNRLIPGAVPLSILGLAVVLMIPRWIRIWRTHTALELHTPFQKPVEMAAAISLGGWFVWLWVAPWLMPWLAWALHR